MSGFHIAIVPVGKFKPEEIRAAASRVTKILREPVELRDSLSVPRTSEDPERGQHRAISIMAELRTAVLQLKPGTLVGAADPDEKPPMKPRGWIFVTDADLYTDKTDGVYAALVKPKGLAIVSVKRLREAFYRRPADPGKQRSRLIKEIVRMAGRLRGMPECGNPDCILAPSKSLPDLDTKSEALCRACSLRMFEGTIRV